MILRKRVMSHYSMFSKLLTYFDHLFMVYMYVCIGGTGYVWVKKTVEKDRIKWTVMKYNLSGVFL